MCIRSNTKSTSMLSDDISVANSDISKKYFYKMKNKVEKSTIKNSTEIDENLHSEPSEPSIELDTLAVMTSYQRKIVEIFNSKINSFHKTSYYKVLLGTTQPAHIVSVLSVTLVMSLVYKSSQPSVVTRSSSPSVTIMMIYLFVFSTHFGSQIWMTFVSGLSLYFSIPRHAFGNVQIVLFPKYFGLNAFLSAVTLICFNQLNHSWNSAKVIQEVTLTVCFLLELTVRIYGVPPLLKLISAKIAIESRVGVGQEIGHHDPGPLKNCPHYKELYKAFRHVHLSVAVCNILTLICSAVHLQYMAYYLIRISNCNN